MLIANSPSTPTPSSTPPPVFPAGSFSFETFLDTDVSDCTPNPSTWRCYPYQTYNQSQSGSATIFNWIITPAAINSSDYLISSTNNPFALEFTNATLKLESAGESTEAYTFQLDMQKVVVPSAPLTADGVTTNCFYNSTTFSATLYTKKASTYSITNGTSSSSSQAFKPWPYAVEVSQVADGGNGTPDCYEVVNGNIGQRVTVGTEPVSQQCVCSYQNYGP